MRKTTSGFTIVELLIVIVVIAILATISVVAYTGIQQRSRDTKRKDDLAKIVKGFQLWAAETNGDFTTMSAGSGGGEQGWFNDPYGTTPAYPSVASVLVDAGYLNNGVIDPINRKSAPVHAYMIAVCNTSTDTTQRVVLAQLENPPSESLADQLGETCAGSAYTNYVTTYGVNYGRMIKLK